MFFVKGGRSCNFTNSVPRLESKTFLRVWLVHGRFKSRTVSEEDIFFCRTPIEKLSIFAALKVPWWESGLPGRLHLPYSEGFF